MYKPVVLIILDGWGIAPAGPCNAISQAKTPNIDRFSKTFFSTTLQASGEAVGLPKGEAGNTETGHINLGAGQIVYQDLARINQAIADGSFSKNQALLQSVKHLEGFNSNLHIMGLVGAGGVHSSTQHLLALLRFYKTHKISRVFLHLFTDGRDSPPTSALTFTARVENEIKKIQVGQIATIMGRYYGMDRDLRWERTQKAYEALSLSKGTHASSTREAISQAYNKKQTDEFIQPTIILDSKGNPLPRIKTNDAVVFFNFRIDRPRQLTKSFVIPDFNALLLPKTFDPYDIKYHGKHRPVKTPRQPFERAEKIKNLFFITMTEYEKGLPVTVAFPPKLVSNPLAKVLADNKLTQLHVSETEKERFITYYFNGLREDPVTGEDRMIIPSAKVPTYDQKPEMSAEEITRTLLERTVAGSHNFIVVNFANADMVGHTGNIKTTISACQVVDTAIGRVALNIIGQGGAVLITSDHGNAEQMINRQTGGVDTEHSLNPVPFIVVANNLPAKPPVIHQGILADVAPTILKLLGIPKPEEMTGKELI